MDRREIARRLARVNFGDTSLGKYFEEMLTWTLYEAEKLSPGPFAKIINDPHLGRVYLASLLAVLENSRCVLTACASSVAFDPSWRALNPPVDPEKAKRHISGPHQRFMEEVMEIAARVAVIHFKEVQELPRAKQLPKEPPHGG